MSGSAAFLKAVEERRTYYGLENKSPISDERIVEIVQAAVKHTPSSFNTQSTRVVVFFHDASVKAWDTIAETFLKNIPEDQKASNQQKFDSFKAGYGSIAVFEDQETIDGISQAMPMYAEGFKIWSEDTSAMHQYVIWTALTAEGLGASLQHYFTFDQEIPKAISKAFDVPTSWKCTAIMPFGTPVGPPGNPAHPKDFKSLDERVKVFR